MTEPARSGPAETPAPDATCDHGFSSEPAEEALVVEELLVEEVSIDGMCGVY